MSNIAFALCAKLVLDSSEYEKGLNDVKSNATSVGATVVGGLKTIGKVGAAAIGAATTAMGVFAGSAVKSYASYEQLAGGIEKLYGTAADKVKGFAEQAYLTAGMSANEYMDTAMQFSASLINSLGGDLDTAANMTDVAMQVISDNVNTFGSDMESVTNAFKGFSKGQMNMLDNLKLGYGGTKEEMERLLRDAEQYGGYIEGSLDINNFSDIIKGIEIVQEHLNIAGTTQKEAMKTIEGSATATKAAWENVITSIGRGEGLSDAVTGLTSALFGASEGEGLLNQVIPRIKVVMEGIGEFIGQAAPFITDKIPGLITSVLPSLIDSGVQLIGALGSGILQNIPQITSVALDIVNQLVNGIVGALPALAKGAIQLVAELGNGLSKGIPTLLPTLVQALMDVLTSLYENMPMLAEAALNLMMGLGQGLLEAIPVLIQNLPTVIQSMVDYFITAVPMFIAGAIQMVAAIVQALPEIVQALIVALPQIAMMLVEAIPQIFMVIVDAIVQNAPALLEAVTTIGGMLFEFIGGIGQTIFDTVGNICSNVINGVSNWLSQLPTNMAYYAGVAIGMFIAFFQTLPSNIAKFLTEGLQKVIVFGSNLGTKAIEIGKTFFENLVNNIKALPSRLMQLGTDMVNAVINLPKKFVEIGLNIVSGLWEGIKGAWDSLVSNVTGLFGSLVQGIKDGLEIHSPSRVFKYIGEMVDRGFALGVTDNLSIVGSAMDNLESMASINPGISAMAASGNNYERQNDIIKLLGQIAANNNVTVVLEGDAEKLFRVVKTQAKRTQQITGQEAFI